MRARLSSVSVIALTREVCRRQGIEQVSPRHGRCFQPARLGHYVLEKKAHGDGLCEGQFARLPRCDRAHLMRSEEHTSELQSLMRTSYAVSCLKNKKTHTTQ